MPVQSATFGAYETRKITTADGVRIHTRRWTDIGSGHGVCVLVHGFLAHAGWWQDVAPLLTRFHTVVALDLSGMGDSDRRDAYSIENHVEEIAAVIRAYRLAGQPVILVGHSFGGGCATAVVSSQPELVNELISLDSIFRLTPKPFCPSRAFSGRSYSTQQQALSRFKLIPEQPEIRPEIVARIAREGLKQQSDGRWRWKFDDTRPMSSPGATVMWNAAAARYRDFTGSRRIIRGEHSALFSPELADGLNDFLGVPGHIETLPGAHHHLLLDQPEALAALLNQPPGR